MKKIFLFAYGLFLVFFAIMVVVDYFSHIIIEEKYTNTIWQYGIITFFALFYIYGAYKMYKNKQDKLYKIIIGITGWLFILYLFFNRQTIVFLHLISDKKLYILKTEITEIIYDHVMKRGAWKEIRIQDYNNLFNTIYVFKGNRHLKLNKGQKIYIYGLKSKFGFTYTDFKYNKDNKYFSIQSL